MVMVAFSLQRLSVHVSSMAAEYVPVIFVQTFLKRKEAGPFLPKRVDAREAQERERERERERE